MKVASQRFWIAHFVMHLRNGNLRELVLFNKSMTNSCELFLGLLHFRSQCGTPRLCVLLPDPKLPQEMLRNSIADLHFGRLIRWVRCARKLRTLCPLQNIWNLDTLKANPRVDEMQLTVCPIPESAGLRRRLQSAISAGRAMWELRELSPTHSPTCSNQLCKSMDIVHGMTPWQRDGCSNSTSHGRDKHPTSYFTLSCVKCNRRSVIGRKGKTIQEVTSL